MESISKTEPGKSTPAPVFISPENRITAIWALSEAALGGVLHAFKIPFTGLFVGSAAVIFISLIACFTRRNGAVLRATVIVLIVKGLVSPHTPVTAFAAVSLQGIAGEILFRPRKYFKTSAIALGIFTLMQSAFQKIFILTLVFGYNLWHSIDILGNYILDQIPVLAQETADYSISLWLISAYAGLHLAMGIVTGIFAANLPGWLNQAQPSIELPPDFFLRDDPVVSAKKRKRKSWWTKPSGILIFILATSMILLSYFIPGIGTSKGASALLMILRSVIVLIVWYFFLGPLFLKLYRKFLSGKKKEYGTEVEFILHLLPTLRRMVYFCWKNSKPYGGFRRFKEFLVSTIALLLTADFSDRANLSKKSQ